MSYVDYFMPGRGDFRVFGNENGTPKEALLEGEDGLKTDLTPEELEDMLPPDAWIQVCEELKAIMKEVKDFHDEYGS
jgi:hypothetical protein